MRQDMGLHVIHRHQWNLQGDGQGFGKGGPHEKRPQQTGALGEGDPVQVLLADSGLLQGTVDHGNDVLLMCPGGQLRNDSSVFRMDLLVGDYI